MFVKKLAFILLGVFLISCSSTELSDSASAEAAFKAGSEFEQSERYEEALAKFNEVKNKHPYSKFATEAKLHIADIHYKREAYVEAQNAYQLFKEFHPTYPKIDYVTFRLALCYFHQLPSTIDRDLSLAENAITYFDEVITTYPNSEYAKEATEKKAEARKKLADKEFYIADFYYIRDQYDSALGRYENLLGKYAQLGLDEKALSGAILSAAKLGDMEKTKKYFNQLIYRFPQSDETQSMRKKMKDYGIQ